MLGLAKHRTAIVKVGVLMWTIILTIALAASAVYFREFNAVAYRGIDPWMILQNVPVVFLAFMLTRRLMRHKVMRWKPSHLCIPPQDGNETKVANQTSMLVRAMQVRGLGVVVSILLIINLPMIAILEEFIFREGTDGWLNAAVRSLLFGLAHFGTNLPLGASLSIGAVGMWFSHWYLLGGIEASAEAHFAYILIIFSLAVPSALVSQLKKQ